MAGTMPSGNGSFADQQEWIVTTTDGLVTKIERVDPVTHVRSELTREEYAGLVAAASFYAAYYAGIRDYATAVAAGNWDVAQAYYQGMSDYYTALGYAQ